ncbi:MAG TPA: aminoglycoside phosphotransferase family protein [Roseiflexaceae bacterium]|nr:aminoglycoside phosphotransferase family protein [Roseiflexaceae bacterium]
MVLSATTLAHYLLERGLIDPEGAVDGDLVIVDASSRNRNFKVIRRGQPSYFVKQAHGDPQSIEFLQREAACYRRAGSEPGFAALAPMVPRYHLYDPQRHLLVLALLPKGENLAEHHRRLGSFPIPTAARLGEQIGTYHRLVTPDAGQGGPGALPCAVPWILSSHRLAASSLHEPGRANQQVLAIIGRYADFHSKLDTLREQWQCDCFIHGDMKWENCLVCPQESDTAISIIDWETADLGDACWDVGAIFQAYLTFWIMSIPIRNDIPPARLLQEAAYPIEAMQPALRAFWLAYAQARQLAPDRQRETLARSTGYAAARMLQTAYEYMYHSPLITPNGLALLQVSLNILTDTKGAISDLLKL